MRMHNIYEDLAPLQLSQKLDMRDLQQPDSSHCDRHNSIHGCAFPNIEVRIGLQSTLASRASD